MNLLLFLAACPCNPSGGYCDGYGGCYCNPGYTGQYCEVLACPCNASGGYCDGYGGCYCYTGYTGQYCDEMLGRDKACRQEGRMHSVVHGACLVVCTLYYLKPVQLCEFLWMYTSTVKRGATHHWIHTTHHRLLCLWTHTMQQPTLCVCVIYMHIHIPATYVAHTYCMLYVYSTAQSMPCMYVRMTATQCQSSCMSVCSLHCTVSDPLFSMQDPMRAARTACMEEPSLEFLAFALKTTTDHSASTLTMDITPVRHV